jgi:hypothetical protein
MIEVIKMKKENISLKLEGKKYDIEYKQTKYVLYFNDKNGAFIGFVKGKGRLSIYVNDKYSNPEMWKKYPRLKGTNAYTLAPKQVKIFLEWFNDKK